MRARLFQYQFAPMILAGTKRQTIRPTPKRPQDLPKVGDVESWRVWTGKPYRSKQLELAQVEIVKVERITIEEDDVHYGVSLNDRPLRGVFEPQRVWLKIATADGFKDIHDLVLWFKKNHGLPFSGILIKAKDK